MATTTASPRKTHYNSLREFLAALEEKDLVHHIRVPVEKDWELGAVCRENFDREGPAVIFERVGHYRTPVLVGLLATRERYALALGVEPTTEAIGERWRRAYAHPVKPRIVVRPLARKSYSTASTFTESLSPFPSGTISTPDRSWVPCTPSSRATRRPDGSTPAIIATRFSPRPRWAATCSGRRHGTSESSGKSGRRAAKPCRWPWQSARSRA